MIDRKRNNGYRNTVADPTSRKARLADLGKPLGKHSARICSLEWWAIHLDTGLRITTRHQLCIQHSIMCGRLRESQKRDKQKEKPKQKIWWLRISYALTAVDLVGSVTAVVVSIALSPDVNASSVGTAELVAMAFFGDTRGSKKNHNSK